MATKTLPGLIALAALAAAAFLPSGQAAAQSGCPAIQTGAVLTAGQWNNCFALKQDALGYAPLNQAGGTMTGLLITVASAPASAGLRLPPGTAPGTPVNGDLWTTSAGMFVRVAGVTVGPLGQSLTIGSAGCFMSNATGGSAIPLCGTLTSGLDQAVGTAPGSLVMRGASVWAALTPGAVGGPLVSQGPGSPLVYGTRSGNTAAYATVSGAFVNGHCLQVDASGNIVDAGGACTTGGGGGTVTSGTINQLAFYASTGTVISGLAAAVSIAQGGTACSVASGTCLDNVTGFSGTGHVVRTGAGAYAFRTLTGTASHLAVTNGSGVAGNPTIDFATAVVFASGFGSFTFDVNTLILRDPSDTTKKGQFDASAIATGQTRSYKLPNANGTIAISASAGILLDATTGDISPDTATASDIWANTPNKIIKAGGLNGAGVLVGLTDAATIAVNMATGINFVVQIAGNRTLGAPTGTQVGRSGCIYLQQDATGNRTLAYNAVWKFAQGIPPVLSTTPFAVDVLCYQVNASSYIVGTMILGVQ